MSSPISEPCSGEPALPAIRQPRRRPADGFALFLALCLVVFLGAAQAQDRVEPAPTASTTGYSIESFQVGRNTYVRSLAVDRRRRALWVGTSIGAQEIDLASRNLKQTFTREQGLANEYVFAIGLDPRGHVWFGTNAGGTSTYLDGEWRTYFPMHGLADYWVYAFAFDRDGKAWIGTWNGVNHFDPATETFKTYRAELINIWVYGVDVDAEGRVWFGTEGGVSMYDGTAWHSWTQEDGLGAPNLANLPQSTNTGLGTRARHDLEITVAGQETYNPNYVFAVLTDRLGRGVWFGTWGGGVSLFDGEQGWTTYTRADGLAGNIVYSIAQSEDGTLWFGTDNGLSRFDGETWTTIRHGLPGRHVYAIAIDGEGSVWVGTKGAVSRLWRDL